MVTRVVKNKHLHEILKDINTNKTYSLQVFYFKVDENQLIERLVNRRTCSKCHAIFNLKTMKLEDETKCNICGGDLTRRDDDTEEIAKKRFKTYFEETAPIIDMYKERGVLTAIDASLDIDTIYKNLKGAIQENVYS